VIPGDADSALARALDEQPREAGGYGEWSASFKELVRLAEADAMSLLERASWLRDGDLEQQILHARLVASIPSIESTHRLSEALSSLKEEPHADVVSWLVVALRETRMREAVPVLANLAAHPAEHVRFAVPDALSACAEDLETILRCLLMLSADIDDDVRWSAVFELVAWLPESDHPAIYARLKRLAETEQVDAVRQLAASAGSCGS